MTLREGLLRLVPASLVAGTLTIVPLAVFVALPTIVDANRPGWMFSGAGMVLVLLFWAVAMLVHAAGLLVFGLPLLFSWPEAFQRGVGRAGVAMVLGCLAATIGFVVVGGALADWGWIAFWSLCGALACLVWWRFNRYAAIDDDSAGDPALAKASSHRIAAIAWVLSINGAVALLLPYLDYRNKLSLVPDGIAVDRIVYEKTEDFRGSRPCSSQTGVLVYATTAPGARALRLAPDLPIPIRNWASANSESRWNRTPIDVDHTVGRDWGQPYLRIGERRPARIANFLARRGYGIAIDAKVEATIDRIFAAPGSYYAEGDCSTLIVVAPQDGLVVFAYAR